MISLDWDGIGTKELMISSLPRFGVGKRSKRESAPGDIDGVQ